MHVVVLNQFYWPSVAATAQLLTDLCEEIARHGHRVTVVATRGDYLGGEGDLPARERHNGVDIRRVRATSFGKGRMAGRMADYASFYALATAELFRVEEPDVYLCLSTPPLIALAGLSAARARGARFVYWCQDVYPDVAVALGALREGGVVARSLDDASRQVLERADAVIAIGENMAEVLEERGAERLVVIHNWADGQAIDPANAPPRERNGFRREVGARDDELLLLYAGNMGRAHEFGAVFHLIERMKDPALAGVRLVFVGDGARRQALVDVAARAGVLDGAVRFLPYQPRERLGEMLCAADAHLICLEPKASGLVVPSKLYGAMASGRPVLLTGPEECETARILRETHSGVQIPADAGEALVNALIALRDEGEARRAQGTRAREAFLVHFARRHATAAFLDVLERGVDGAERARGDGRAAWSPSASPS